MNRMSRVTATVVVVLAAGLAAVGPARASCAGSPADSPNAFTGTVLEVEKDGRVAHVVLDSGRRVVVHGSPELGGRTATSVDRHFVAGARYEFHPFNDSSPFQDNACTATRQLAGPTPEPVEPNEDRLPGWLPVDEQAGPAGYAMVGGGLLLLATLVGLIRLAARRRLGS